MRSLFANLLIATLFTKISTANISIVAVKKHFIIKCHNYANVFLPDLKG